MEDLDEIRDVVRSRRSRLAELGATIVWISYPMRTNDVRVGIEGRADLAREAFSDLGEGVMVEAAEHPIFDVCNDYTDCPKAKGGIELVGTKIISGNHVHCTAGFVGKQTSPGTAHLVLLTAGHCFEFGQEQGEDTWRHNGDLVGHQDGRVWQKNQYNPKLAADVGVIDLDGDFVPSDKNRLLTRPTSSGLGDVDSQAGYHAVGDPVCAFGVGSHTKRCGDIYAHSFDNLTCKNPGTGSDAEPCSMLAYTITVDFDMSPGDSGGPYWEGGQYNESPWKAMGMHTHSDKDGTTSARAWYVPISTQLGALADKGIDVYLCTNTNCTP